MGNWKSHRKKTGSFVRLVSSSVVFTDLTVSACTIAESKTPIFLFQISTLMTSFNALVVVPYKA